MVLEYAADCMSTPLDLLPARTEMERAVKSRDASYDGIFYFAVRTTGVFCRPSCPSRAEPRNVEFFATPRDCLSAGYRPCRRCDPLRSSGAPPEWVAKLLARMQTQPDLPLRPADIREAGSSPERARRWFKAHYGMSLAAWCRGSRLSGAFDRIRDGASLDDAGYEAGYQSQSGFREAFSQTFGRAPGKARETGDREVLTWVESPLGPLLAGALDAGLCRLEYPEPGGGAGDGQGLDGGRDPGRVRLPGIHPVLEVLRRELAEYFDGRRQTFTVPVVLQGTPFQERVWNELRRIPHGATISYEELARRMGQPTARRAVAQANGVNRIAILIPCHRVIGKDGRLTGYGGGLWRKRLLLELERTGRLPG